MHALIKLKFLLILSLPRGQTKGCTSNSGEAHADISTCTLMRPQPGASSEGSPISACRNDAIQAEGEGFQLLRKALSNGFCLFQSMMGNSSSGFIVPIIRQSLRSSGGDPHSTAAELPLSSP